MQIDRLCMKDPSLKPFYVGYLYKNETLKLVKYLKGIYSFWNNLESFSWIYKFQLVIANVRIIRKYLHMWLFIMYDPTILAQPSYDKATL